jgi:TPR repeat protein
MKKALIVVLAIIAGMATFWAAKEFSAGPKAANLPPPQPAVDVTEVRAKAEAGDAAAQAQLGRLYAKGEGVTNSYAEAAKWYRRSADQGNSDGQFGLGELYEAGRGVNQDPNEAVKYYRLAADQGNVGAQYTLGFSYEAGRGVPKDHIQAAKWFRLAADQGDPYSQYDLGQRYELGLGVGVDRVEALKWYLIAGAQGQADSIRKTASLQSSLSREEVAEAKRRAAAFSPKTGLKP